MTSRNESSAISPLRRFWLPTIYLALGMVILIARAIDDDLRGGLIWGAVMAAIGALFVLGGRFDLIKQARGNLTDEREVALHAQAMATTGSVLVGVLTGMIVFELSRGKNPDPYSTLMMIGGLVYFISLFVLHRRS